jgi:putative ABC transport system substrate-binding protein
MVTLLALPLLAASQPAQKVFRVGHVAAGGRPADGLPPRPLREKLRELGYVEGQNIVYEARFAATAAAKPLTSTLPIVMAPASGDAVATGMIASLARPGQNITGLTDESVQLSAKRMELLKEAVPKAARIAILWNSNDQGMTLRYREIEKAARILHVEVQAHGVRGPDDFDTAFSAMTRQRPDAMFLVADAITILHRKRFIEFATTQRIPAMYETDVHVRDGGLMSYGPNFEDSFRQAAVYVDRILKGAKPSDLPAQQPTTYLLAVNLKTAATLGLTMPPSLLLRADQVVQ